ncbi:MAG: methyltransferase domain-containing protein [Proteobacteria bacterium]|nr:methyltransferase domain-containing protein [Pseudomonadota bacterium]
MIDIDACVVCGGTDFLTITDRGMHFNGEKVAECRNCGMVFLSPRMTLTELDIFYSQNQFSKEFRGSAAPNETIMAAREERALKKMTLIEKYLEYLPVGPVLEIGCSSGYLLRNLRDKGYQVYGIDPSDGFVQYARDNYKLDVVSGMYPDAMPAEWGKHFAMIIALHVLEHTDDPAYILGSIFEMLAKDGLLALELPDIHRAVSVRKYLHQDYFQKSHIWDFSASTIKILLEKCGFEVYVCDNYSNDPPDDKNVLLIAGNPNSKLTVLEKSNGCQKEFAEKLYRNLKYKLLLGRAVNFLRGFQ